MEGRPPPDDLFEGTDVAPGEDVSRGSIGDGVKKAILAGVGALFLGEESARRLAREWKLPKEVIGFIGQQAQGAKDEVLRAFTDEIRRFLESGAVREEFWKGLGDRTIEVRAEIRFRRDSSGTRRPSVQASARTKRKKKGRR
jgi:hypothetical protein